MLARGSRTLLRHGRVAARGSAPSAAATRTTAARTLRATPSATAARTTAARRTAWRTLAGGQPRPPAPAPPAPPPPPPAKYAAPPPPLRPQQYQQQQLYEEPPQTFGSTMKTYFTLGIGVSLGVTAFSVLLRMIGF